MNNFQNFINNLFENFQEENWLLILFAFSIFSFRLKFPVSLRLNCNENILSLEIIFVERNT